MKGQRLHVRPANADDHAELKRFYSIESAATLTACHPPLEPPALIGKLVGDLVAHLSYAEDDSSLIIESVYVARLLRRKRVGRFMVSELEKLASARGHRQIRAARDDRTDSFFRALRFIDDREAPVLTKTITPGRKQ